jgi:hypothetical protein
MGVANVIQFGSEARLFAQARFLYDTGLEAQRGIFLLN